MKIAILNYHTIGGSGIVAYEIGRVMAEERGHEVHFVGLEPPFRLEENLHKNLHFHRIWIHEYPVFTYPPYTLALVSQLAEIIKIHNIDVIHSHYALPHAIAAILARDVSKRKVTCVTTLHGTDITIVGAHPAMKMITCYAIEKSDVVTAVSHFLKKETERIFNVCTGKIECVYNFINPRTFNPEMRSNKEDNSEKKIIMHISNLRPIKRPLYVIRIFHKMLKAKAMPMELWVIGDGPGKTDMMIMAEELSIQDKVKFLGVKHPVGPLIARADLMLIPSVTESFGMAALEAMACGVPVVATNTGGIPEVIEDGVSGLLFDLEDIDGAADKAISLLTDKTLSSRIREQGINVAFEKFDYIKIIEKYEKLYMG
ncbi:MAG: N-acetyl-alpha-D-glucosaminyl L-malate synthase BshA [Spirochaetales bacterium]|nr:N-acetyl-alpha-D-glucosaminyl L-malate synthase BshA [Spirochaetales bacterium]